jgi:hypothetical protein
MYAAIITLPVYYCFFGGLASAEPHSGLLARRNWVGFAHDCTVSHLYEKVERRVYNIGPRRDKTAEGAMTGREDWKVLPTRTLERVRYRADLHAIGSFEVGAGAHLALETQSREDRL